MASLLSTLPLAQAKATKPESWGNWPQWGDRGDGTYNNPVIPSDYSDLDCIRIGSDYYAISSTMQYSPGMAVLHSRDLVNWTIIGHAVPDVRQIGPEMNWNRMDRYGRGIWAGAIRYHRGRFWVYFGTPDEGYFVTTAAQPSGPWEPLHQIVASSGWDDCCPFWDDDGQGYFVGTHFADNYKTYLWKLAPNGRELIPESRTLINEGKHREANKLYKINGCYYHLFSEVNGARVVMAQRSKNIAGPYGERRQLTDQNRNEHEPNQGGLVDTEKGDWYFLTHHGRGAWEGRCTSLLPVTWIDGWPIIGETTASGAPGKMVWSGKLPVAGTQIVTPQSSDEFTARSLAPQWEWNHHPRSEMWSLDERPGWLRLKAFKPLQADNLYKVGNLLTQRSFRTNTNEVIVKFDLSGMASGQKAGLCHIAATFAMLGVSQQGTTRTLEFRNKDKTIVGPTLTGTIVWLKSSWGLAGESQFAFSEDGESYSNFGEAYQLSWGSYRGDRIGIYSYNNNGEAGFVDVDWLHYSYNGDPARH